MAKLTKEIKVCGKLTGESSIWRFHLLTMIEKWLVGYGICGIIGIIGITSETEGKIMGQQ